MHNIYIYAYLDVHYIYIHPHTHTYLCIHTQFSCFDEDLEFPCRCLILNICGRHSTHTPLDMTGVGITNLWITSTNC